MFIMSVLIILLLAMASCTKQQVNDQKEVTQGEVLEPLTLRIVTIGDQSLNGRQYEFSKVVDIASEMTMEKYNTSFVMEFIPKYDDYVLRVESGEPADILSTSISDKWIEEGLLADLTEILPRLYPEKWQLVQDIKDDDSPIFYDGKIYLVPDVYQTVYTNKYCLAVDKEFYNAAGRPQVSTVEDLISLALFGVDNQYFNRQKKQCFTVRFNDLIDLVCQEKGYVYLDYGFGLKDGTVVALEETDILKDCFEILYLLNEKEAVLTAYNDVRSIETNGVKMSLVNSEGIYHNDIRDHLRFNEKYEFLYMNDTIPYSDIRLFGRYGIVDNENVERSLIFLRCVETDQELNRLLCYGVEDVHYKFQGEKYYVPGDVFKVNNNFCKPTKPLIHINDPVGKQEYQEQLKSNEKQIIPGIPNDQIFIRYDLDELIQQRFNLLYNYFGDGVGRPVMGDDTFEDYQEQFKSKQQLRDKFTKEYQEQIDDGE